MMLFGDFSFFICMAAALVPAVILGAKERPLKYYAFGATLVFALLAIGGNVKELGYMAAFCFLEFAVLRLWLFLVDRYGRNGKLFVLFLAFGMAPLAASKLFASAHISVFGFIGISYMTFRILQMLIEVYDGLIKKIPAFDYFSFILFFPSLLSGPIDRSRRYGEDLNRIMPKKDYLEQAGAGIVKIMIGLTYKFVIAASIYQLILWAGMKHTMGSALIYMYSYGFYLFFDFAGYSLMAIGCSYILGIRMPDNFKAPFISKDIADFWNRWHITLSHWFRDYLFSRLMMRWIKKKRFSSRLTAASCGFMVNMTVMGLWHGLTVYYIIYGLYHGVLLALTEVWQKKSKIHKKHKKERWYIITSTVITFNLVMFGLFIFSGRFTELFTAWIS